MPARARYPSPQDELDHAAGEFDEAYTWLTALQRELIAASRDPDLPNARAVALSRKAWAAARAIGEARAVSELVDPDPHATRVEAVRGALLVSPTSPELTAALLASLKRRDGFKLLSELLDSIAGETLDPGTLAVTRLHTLVAAVGGVGDRRAAFALDYANLDMALTVQDASPANLQTLSVALEILGEPEGLSILNGNGPKPRANASGVGEGPAVITAYLRGAERAGIRFEDHERLALSDTSVWPADAGDVAQQLAEWSLHTLGPLVVEAHVALLRRWPAEHDQLREQLTITADAHHAHADAHYDPQRPDDENAVAEQAWLAAQSTRAVREVAVRAVQLRQALQTPEAGWGAQHPLMRSKRVAAAAGELLAWAGEIAGHPVPLPVNVPGSD